MFLGFWDISRDLYLMDSIWNFQHFYTGMALNLTNSSLRQGYGVVPRWKRASHFFGKQLQDFGSQSGNSGYALLFSSFTFQPSLPPLGLSTLLPQSPLFPYYFICLCVFKSFKLPSLKKDCNITPGSQSCVFRSRRKGW